MVGHGYHRSIVRDHESYVLEVTRSPTKLEKLEHVTAEILAALHGPEFSRDLGLLTLSLWLHSSFFMKQWEIMKEYMWVVCQLINKEENKTADGHNNEKKMTMKKKNGQFLVQKLCGNNVLSSYYKLMFIFLLFLLGRLNFFLYIWSYNNKWVLVNQSDWII